MQENTTPNERTTLPPTKPRPLQKATPTIEDCHLLLVPTPIHLQLARKIAAPLVAIQRLLTPYVTRLGGLLVDTFTCDKQGVVTLTYHPGLVGFGISQDHSYGDLKLGGGQIVLIEDGSLRYYCREGKFAKDGSLSWRGLLEDHDFAKSTAEEFTCFDSSSWGDIPVQWSQAFYYLGDLLHHHQALTTEERETLASQVRRQAARLYSLTTLVEDVVEEEPTFEEQIEQLYASQEAKVPPGHCVAEHFNGRSCSLPLVYASPDGGQVCARCMPKVMKWEIELAKEAIARFQAGLERLEEEGS